LAGNRMGQKADEIAGMPRLQGDADLAVGILSSMDLISCRGRFAVGRWISPVVR
jgi:hypothetical protein